MSQRERTRIAVRKFIESRMSTEDAIALSELIADYTAACVREDRRVHRPNVFEQMAAGINAIQKAPPPPAPETDNGSPSRAQLAAVRWWKPSTWLL